MNILLRSFVVYHVACTLLQECSASRILAYIPLPFYSHQAAYRQLYRELADRGHNVTLITLNPMEPHENITQIDLSEIYGLLEEKRYFNLLTSGEQTLKNLIFVFNLLNKVIDLQLSHPKVRDLINGDEGFDLVITEFYKTLGAVFAYRFNCSLIGTVSMDATSAIHNIMGNPTHPVLYPDTNLGATGKLNLKQRFISVLLYICWNLFLKYFRAQNYVTIQKHFGNHVPSMYDLEKHMSLLFINSNPVFHVVRPLHTHTINVGGGIHIEKPKPLPKDIQEFLDKSEEGVIYFSLGSSIRSSQLSNQTKAVMNKAFSQLPYKILWKYEQVKNEFSFSKNVRILEWVPQQDVLRHPNVKLFIMQGGLFSLEEALFIGVPVLVLPFFGDQFLNAQKVLEHGFGLFLDPNTLEVDEFTSTILELITSSKYKESALRLADQMLDRPWTSLDRAVWWTEYLLRHGNTDIFKHPYTDIPFYQYYFLDILFIVLCTFICLFYCLKLIYKIAVYLIIYVFRTNNRKVKEH